MYGDAEWNGRRFVIVDTGGLEVDTDDPIELKVQEQARLAIGEADVILFVVDAVSGMTPADQEAAELLRKATAPVLVAANKVDNTAREADAAEFWSLGWSETYPISASHGRGTGDLLDAIVWSLPPESDSEIARKTREDEAEAWAKEVSAGRLEPFVVDEAEAEEDDDGSGAEDDEVAARWDAAIAVEADEDEPAAITFVGRPNVGKSSLLNALLGEDRAIVSDVPGTTRDAIDTTLEWGRSEVVLIDTAGIKRRGKVASGPAAERYSTLRALKAIARSDVAVLVIDAVEGLTAQDAHVAGYVIEEGRGLVVAVNKWDIVEDKTDRTFDQYVEWIRNEVPFLDFAPVVSISAKTGQRVGRGARARDRHLGRAPEADRDRRAEPGPPARLRAPAAAGRPRPPPEDLLRHAGRRRAADLRVLRERRRLDPFQLPALPREPAPGRVRVRRNADQARLPGPRVGAPAAAALAAWVEDDRQDVRGEVHGATRLDGRSQQGSMSAAARVAVVGAGAWGTTLAVLIARAEPVVLLAQDPEAAARIDAARENASRLPGVELPTAVAVTADPAAIAERRPRRLRRPVGPSPVHRRRGRPRRSPRSRTSSRSSRASSPARSSG